MNDRPVEEGGMGAHDPAMDVRVTRIEDQFDRIEPLLQSIDDRVHKLEIDGAEFRARLPQLATRDDLAELRIATRDDITALRLATRDDIAALRLATREDIAALRLATREDLAELKGAIAQLATREAVAEIKGRVSQLPTTLTLIGFAIAVLAAGGFMRHFFP